MYDDTEECDLPTETLKLKGRLEAKIGTFDEA